MSGAAVPTILADVAIARERTKADELAFAERQLKAAMAAMFVLAGFTALRAANALIEAEIARECRAIVATEGWIA